MTFDYQTLLESNSHLERMKLSREAELPGARGGAVRVLDEAKRRYCLKAASSDAPPPRPGLEARFATLSRELSFLESREELTDNLLILGEVTAEKVWLLTRWVDLPNLHEATKSLRLRGTASNSDAASFCRLVCSVATKVGSLHEAGFVHGDLQPRHILIDASTGSVQLLDFELTHQPAEKQVRYSGGLVHYNAPEIAQLMLAGRHDIAIDPLAEVYSLCSLLFFCLTGSVSGDYGNPDLTATTLEAKLSQIAQGRKNSFESTGISSHPAVVTLLSWGLQAERSARCPSLAELAESSRKIADELGNGY